MRISDWSSDVCSSDLAVPQPALDAELPARVVDGHGVGGVGLQLHRVGAGRGGRLHQSKRALEVAVVVAQHLGDDVARLAGSDLASCDLAHGSRSAKLRVRTTCIKTLISSLIP